MVQNVNFSSGIPTLFSLTSSQMLSMPITLLSLDYGVWVLAAVLPARRTHRKPRGLGQGQRGGQEARTSREGIRVLEHACPKETKKRFSWKLLASGCLQK